MTRDFDTEHDSPPLTFMAWLRHDLIWESVAELPAGSRLLEVGAGQGAMAVRLARRFEYTGVEADEASASIARVRLNEAGLPHTLHNDRFEAAALDPPYDVLCAFEVLEHVEDDESALAGWLDLLAPAGRLVISVPAWQERYGPMDERVGHYRRYEPEALSALLRKVGFENEDVCLYGFPLGYMLESVRNRMARAGTTTEKQEGTAISGRLYQPSSRQAALATDLITRPFRLVQRRTRNERLGTGIVARAQRPA